MVRLLAVVALSGVAFAQSAAPASPARPATAPPPPAAQNSAPQTPASPGTLPSPSAGAQQETFPAPQAPTAVMGKLPPLPAGKSTVLGGEITSINPVLDQFTLHIFGGGSLKILYDERTQAFINGDRISVLDLKPIDHASVETTLEGSNVYAKRIHMLTTLPQGNAQGQVTSYDPRSGRLVISPSMSQQPITVVVPGDTPVVRVGQDVFTSGQRGTEDLAPGALVTVQFVANGGGLAKATHIDVLATPGASFQFAGVLEYLDVPNGEMTILDPRENQAFHVVFSQEEFPVSRQLHVGQHIRVAADFDGHHYVATSITPVE